MSVTQVSKINFDELVRFFPSPVLVIEKNGTIIANTAQAAQLFGLLNGRSLQGMKIWDLIAPVDRNTVHVDFYEYLQGNNGHEAEYYHVKSNNTVFSASWKMSVVTSEEGNIKAVIVEIRGDATSQNIKKKVTEKMVETIAYVAEMRDKYTAKHQRRVAHLAHAIAQEIGLAKEDVARIHMIGNIHDIGKICVPAEFLSKPDKLTDEEFGVIKTHVRAGLDILKTLGCPSDIFTGVYQHHERLNGRGYPEGVKDKDICTAAKILAVCDVAEAMSSHRPYRPALGVDLAMEEISDKSGDAYDTEIADACLNLFTKQNFIFCE